MIDAIELTGELKNEVATLEQLTKSVSVKNAGERVAVYQAVLSVKIKRKAIVDFFAESKQAAAAAHKAICANEKSFTDKLDAFESAGKLAIGQYDAVEEQKRLAEQRRLQAIADEKARAERAKIEAEAARQRAIQAEAERKAREAREAAESASKEERERLLREAAAAEAKAAKAEAKADTQAEAATFVQAAVVEVAPVAVKQAGESTKQIWKARVINAALVPDMFKIVDEKALDSFARSTKGAKEIPGVVFYSESSMSVRTKTF